MAKKFNKEKYWANKYAKNVRMPQDIILNNLRMEQHFGNSGKPDVDAGGSGALRDNIIHQFAEHKLNQNFREGFIDRLDQANNNLNVETFKPIDIAAMPLTFDKRETLQMRMDTKEYIARERRDNFDFDGFYNKYKDTPIGELKDMVDGNGIDFGKFIEQNQNTPLSNIESSYIQSSNILEPFSSTKTANVDNTYDYNQSFIKPDYVGIQTSNNNSFYYGSVYNQNDDIDYYNAYGTIGDTQNKIDSSTFKTDIEGINSNGFKLNKTDTHNIYARDGYYNSDGLKENSFDITGFSEEYKGQTITTDMDTINKNGFQSNFVDNTSLSAEAEKYNSDGFENNSIKVTGITDEYNTNSIKEHILAIDSSESSFTTTENNYDGHVLSRDDFYNLEKNKNNPLNNRQYTEQEKKILNEYDSSGGVKSKVDNYDFKRRFGTTKKKYSGEVEELFEKKGHIYDEILNETKKDNKEKIVDMFGNEISKEEIEARKKVLNNETRNVGTQETRNTETNTDDNRAKTEETRNTESNTGTDAGTDTGRTKSEETRNTGTETGKTTDTGRTKAEDFMKGGRYYNGQNSQRNNNDNNRTVNDGFNYGEKNSEDSITVRELLSDIYGDDYDDVKAREFVYDLAKTKGGKEYLKDKEIYKNKYRHEDLIINSKNGAISETVGSELAKKYYDDVVDKDNNINRDKIIEISDQYKKYGNLDKVEDSFNKNIRKNIFDKEYSKVEKDFKLKSSNIEEEGRKISEVLKKISDEKVLLPEEVESFRKYQKLIGDTKEEMRTWAENLGYSAESVFGEEFKLTPYEKKKNKSNKKLKNYGEDTGDVEGTRLYQFNKGSFNTVNYRDIKYSDIKMNDDGTWTTYSEETKKTLKEELGTLEENQEYFKAVRDSGINKDNYLDYLKDNEDALTTDNAKKLFKLKQNGVDIGEDAESVLQGLAISKEAGLKPDNTSLNKLNSAVDTLSSNNYMNITDENIDRIKSGNLIYENGKYKLRDLNLTENQRNSEAFKNILNSKNVGSENINDILDADKINNSIQSSNGAYKVTDEMIDKYKETVSKRFSSLKDGNDVTGYTIEEQLIQNKVDPKLAKEIAEAKKNGAENLSADARNALYNMGELDETLVDFGKIKQDDLKKMINENKSLFGADNKDIDSMSETELRKMFGDTMNNTTSTGIKEGALASGFKFKVQGKDITDSKDFVSFYNSIIDTDKGDIAWKNLFGAMSMTEEGQVGFKDAYNWMMSGKKLSEFKQMKVAESVKEQVYKMLNESDKIDGLSTDDIAKMKATAKRIKETKAEDVYKYMNMDEISKNVGKLEKVEDVSKGMFSGLKGKGGTALKIAGAAGILAGIGGIGIMANNAAEERERKRQEMQQLMMAQNQSIRGGY